MGLFDRFRKEEVSGTKVLACGLDARFNATVEADGKTYRRFYPATTTQMFSNISDLASAISQRYDVVHLLGDVSADGGLKDGAGKTLGGKQLIQNCCDADVKLLWVASDNKADGYNKGLNARGQKINVVLNIDRKGPYFPLFLIDLFTKISAGESFQSAWNALCNVDSKSVQPDVPESILFAGRGGVHLR